MSAERQDYPDVVPHDALAHAFFHRFRGLERFHGHAWILGAAPAGEKQEAGAKGVHEPVTPAQWADHLDGVYGVGQTPIRDDHTCVFGAIDIDVYDLDHVLLATKIDVNQMPLVLCRTKSGGAHLYLFLTEPVPASLVRAKLMEMAVVLGYAKVEVYPKQTRLASVKDVGNWINMPYFGARGPDPTVRHAIRQSGDAILDPAEFLVYAASRAISERDLKAYTAPEHEKLKDKLQDAPPCLVSLAASGFGKGSRNNALFSVGVYLRKRFPDDWEERLDEYNTAFIDPPLGSKEVQMLTRSLQKKSYAYRCNDSPLDTACNKQICLTKKYGIGSQPDDPGVVFGSLAVIPSNPPIWIWDVNGERIELATNEIKDQGRLHTRVIEQLRIWPRPMKPAAWADLIRGKLATAEVLEVPPDLTEAGQIKSYLDDYIRRRAMAELDALTRNIPVREQQPDGTWRAYFHSLTFKLHLEKEHRYKIENRKLWTLLRERGVESGQRKISGQTLNLWSVPCAPPDEKLDAFKGFDVATIGIHPAGKADI